MRAHHLARLAPALLLVAAFSLQDAWGAVTGRYDVSLLRVRFSDTTDARYTVAQLNAAAAEMHDFFSQLSQGRLDLQFRVADVAVGRPWADYHGGCMTCSLVADAAEAAAAGGMSFAGVEGILVVRAGCREDSGWTNGPATFTRPGVSGTFHQSYDVECERSTLPSTVSWGNWAHELGHQLEGQDGRWDLTHPSGYASGYNLMDSCYPCGEGSWSLAEETLVSETGVTARKLVFPGWLPATRIREVTPTASPGETVVLSPVSDDTSVTTAPHGIKIRISPGRYYFLEVKRRLRADAWPTIHDEGVQIMRVDESATPPGTMINACQLLAGGCNLTGAAPCDVSRPVSTHPQCWPFVLWKTGNTFTDTTNGLAIRIGPEVGNGFSVTVMQIRATGLPDLYVTPWLTPPMHTYETIDLWVDSSCNGYESDGAPLRYGRRPDRTVIGNGDDPCANHPNRVFARVRNIGTTAANDVRVRFDVTDPLGVGITGPAGWRTLGTATSAKFSDLTSIPPGGEATVWMAWIPIIDVTGRPSTFDHHSCIRVAATPVAGEEIVTNLDGDGEQENIDHFQISAGRRPVGSGNAHERSFRLMNDDKRLKTFTFIIESSLPPGWKYTVGDGSTEITLQPGESRQIPVRIVPAGEVKAGTSWHLRVAAYTLEPARIPPYVHTKRRHLELRRHGGVEFAAQAVDETRIEAGVKNGGKTLRVAGRLQPPIAGAFIGIDYVLQGGKTVTHIVKTDEKGGFADDSMPSAGILTVRAFWQGSATQASAETPDISLQGGEAKSGK